MSVGSIVLSRYRGCVGVGNCVWVGVVWGLWALVVVLEGGGVLWGPVQSPLLPPPVLPQGLGLWVGRGLWH